MSGWRLVPEEPTAAMLSAAARSLDIWREQVPGNPQRKAAPDEKHAIRYRAMLGAAPAPTTRTPDAGCPIGLDNSPDICSAGTCFVCVQDRLADMHRQAAQDALALREAVRQVERLTLERDRYKALAEGERERIVDFLSDIANIDWHPADYTRHIRLLPAPSLPDRL
jgi:hypothetical protein